MGNSIPSEASDVCPYKLASPHHLLPITTPLLVAIGTADKDVPPDLVREFYDRVAAAPAPASLVAAGRENHTSTAATSNTAAVSAATAVSKAHPGNTHPVNIISFTLLPVLSDHYFLIVP